MLEISNSTLVLTVHGTVLSLDSVGAVNAARGEVKTPGRRVSAPPVVNSHGQQRALLREKSKENQLDRNGFQQQDRDSDKGGFDLGQCHAVIGPLCEGVDLFRAASSFSFYSFSVLSLDSPFRITMLVSVQAWFNY